MIATIMMITYLNKKLNIIIEMIDVNINNPLYPISSHIPARVLVSTSKAKIFVVFERLPVLSGMSIDSPIPHANIYQYFNTEPQISSVRFNNKDKLKSGTNFSKIL
ncbi:MAG: hypothetical protein WAZ12_02930 [Candidatus Absconditicoccaceae bacterium]